MKNGQCVHEQKHDEEFVGDFRVHHDESVAGFVWACEFDLCLRMKMKPHNLYRSRDLDQKRFANRFRSDRRI